VVLGPSVVHHAIGFRLLALHLALGFCPCPFGLSLVRQCVVNPGHFLGEHGLVIRFGWF
jgi:hypothetical protein